MHHCFSEFSNNFSYPGLCFLSGPPGKDGLGGAFCRGSDHPWRMSHRRCYWETTVVPHGISLMGLPKIPFCLLFAWNAGWRFMEICSTALLISWRYMGDFYTTVLISIYFFQMIAQISATLYTAFQVRAPSDLSPTMSLATAYIPVLFIHGAASTSPVSWKSLFSFLSVSSAIRTAYTT